MTRLLDALLTTWILFVAVVYYGGAVDDRIGSRTWLLGIVYVAMLIFSAVHAYVKYSRQAKETAGSKR
ncbi:MAG: hypothetical protein P4L33_20040 [Capsulimonadaceae bacterium]|nr:hypothetical protein [Capsulimonadaceae bacterium]